MNSFLTITAYLLAIVLGAIVAAHFVNTKWIDAAAIQTFVKYNRKFYKVVEIKIEEVENGEENTS